MVKGMKTLLSEKNMQPASTLKSAQLQLVRKHRMIALKKSRERAVKYCEQFVPKAILSVAPIHMLDVSEDPKSGDISIKPAVSTKSSKDTTGATLVAAIPLVLDLARALWKTNLK